MDKHACNMFKFQSCQTSEYSQSCLHDFNANAETIAMDEETIDDELEKISKMQSAINRRKMQLQTAKDKTAKPWNLAPCMLIYERVTCVTIAGVWKVLCAVHVRNVLFAILNTVPAGRVVVAISNFLVRTYQHKNGRQI
jgi:hypothetical protein